MPPPKVRGDSRLSGSYRPPSRYASNRCSKTQTVNPWSCRNCSFARSDFRTLRSIGTSITSSSTRSQKSTVRMGSDAVDPLATAQNAPELCSCPWKTTKDACSFGLESGDRCLRWSATASATLPPAGGRGLKHHSTPRRIWSRSMPRNRAWKLPLAEAPVAFQRWMISKKIGPTLVLVKICSSSFCFASGSASIRSSSVVHAAARSSLVVTTRTLVAEARVGVWRVRKRNSTWRRASVRDRGRRCRR